MLIDFGLDEARRIICEQEPLRPSTRLNRLAASIGVTIGSRAANDRKQRAEHLRGELDWIVMKTLEKHRTGDTSPSWISPRMCSDI